MRFYGYVLSVLAALAAGGAASAAALTPEQAQFRAIYQQLIEIDTTASRGDTAEAARAMRRRLLDAGFAPGDVQVFQTAPRKGNLVARLRGDGSKRPLLLLAHIDVVEARPQEWHSDPFKLQEKDGVFSARGAIDDKALASIFVSVLGQLHREGFKSHRDIVLALTTDEELGDRPGNGARWLLEHHRDLVDAEFGLNEGARGELKDGKPLVNLVQIGEKQFARYEFESSGPGGHSARPTPDNTIYNLAGALVRLQQWQFPVRLNPAARAYFARTANLESGQRAADMRALADGTADAAAVARLSAQPNLIGLMRTTCVATLLDAGQASNALAQHAHAVINCRILPDDDPDAVTAKLREIAGPRVALTVGALSVHAPLSPIDNAVLPAVEAVSAGLWPGVPVVPILGVSTTDSRFFRSAGIPMYGVSGLFVDPAHTGVHGIDEHIGVRRLYDGREFMVRLIRRLAAQ